MASKMATPRYYIQHSRFMKQDGWELWDVSLSLNGNIAVTGYNENTYRTYTDVYTNVRHSDSRDKPKIIYSKEFEKYESEGRKYGGRYVSFYPGSDTTILSGLGDKLEVIDLIQDRVIKSRKIKLVKHGDLFGAISCLSVRETEIFIGFFRSNKITVYDVIDLNEIKSIILQGIQDGYFPFDMTAITDRIFVCVGDGKEGSNYKSLIFEEKKGRILSELTKPTDTVHWYVGSVGVNVNTLGIAAVVWSDSYYCKEGEHNTVVFYSLLSENNCSFLIVEVESGVCRIRISDRGNRMITGNKWTGEVKVYDMAEVFTYSHLKEKLASTLQTDECTKLANFFKIPKDQTDDILRSDRPSENLFLALEKKGILQSHNFERLIKAFEELTINPFCSHVAEIFWKTRSPTFYIELIQKLEENVGMVKTASKDETRQLKEKTNEVEGLQKKLKELRTRQEAHLKITQERDKFKAEHDKGQLQLSSLHKELEASKKTKVETERVLREKTTEVADLQKKLRKLQDAHLKSAQERDKFKVEHDKGQLQIFSLQKDLEASKKAKIETEKVLKQTEEFHQKVIQERNEIKTALEQLKIEHSLGSISLEEGRSRQADIEKKVAADTTDDVSSTTSPVKSKFLPESSLGDEFAKLLVRVSVKLNTSNCIMIATYFNLPESKIDLLQKESETPGIRLFRLLKERNIINMYDVTHLQEALSVLHLLEVNETLVIPYQSQIDPLLYQQNKITKKEH